MSFDHLIVTAPTERTARVYAQLLEELKRGDECGEFLSAAGKVGGTRLHCVADPVGVRIGSGGGTLNALDHVEQLIGREGLRQSKVLIIHSGGDSRRAPLHSVCGKAWASLNCDGGVSSPMALLVAELSRFCARRLEEEGGAVVIASSDVLLDIVGEAAADIPADAVSVVGVPEAAEVAKNHGVLVGETDDSTTSCRHYLQKPSMAAMREHGALDPSGAVFIDTGVVIATGAAFTALLQLLDNDAVSLCTSRRIASAGPAAALRLELYSDLLHACRLHRGASSLQEYLQRLGPAPPSASALTSALTAVHAALKAVPLALLAVRPGRFFHLGTSAESLEMLCCVDAEPGLAAAPPGLSKAAWFSRKCGLRAEVGSVVWPRHGARAGQPSRGRRVLMNALLLPTAPGDDEEQGGEQEGVGSVVEHSCLSGHFRCGPSSVVSHVDPHWGRDLAVGAGVMVQQVQLSAAGDDAGPPGSVLLVLGVGDDVKAASSVCGGSWGLFLRLAGVEVGDVWGDGEQSLWTARIFCVAPCGRPSVVLRAASLWMQHLGALEGDKQGGSRADLVERLAQLCGLSVELTLAALEHWRAARRVSLSDLLAARGTPADAGAMASWRRLLRTALQPDRSGDGCLRWDEGGAEEVVAEVFALSRAAQLALAPTLALTSQGTEASAAASLLALWVVALCGGDEAAVEAAARALPAPWGQCIALCPTLWALWQRATGLGSQAAWLVAMHLRATAGLGDLQTGDGSLLAMRVLLSFMPALPPRMHPRALLVAAWAARLPSGGAEQLPCGGEVLAPWYARWAALGVVSREHAGEYGAAVSEPLGLGLGLGLGLPSVPLLAPTHPAPGDRPLSRQLQDAAQFLVGVHVRSSEGPPLRFPAPSGAPPSGAVLVTAPVRIDFAGGWSDTPPICYEQGGSVLNAAVTVDGRRPIRCAARRIAEPELVLRSLRFEDSGNSSGSPSRALAGDVVTCVRYKDLADMKAQGPCALLKAAVVALGVLGDAESLYQRLLPDRAEESLAPELLQRLGGGLELACLSDIPAGSGMGGSSILAAAVLRALAECLGLEASPAHLVRLVLQCEAWLTTGGGWQDQIGGSVGGVKIGRCTSGLPLVVGVEACPVSAAFSASFARRVFLVYTGQQRLAKDVLIHALRRAALTPGGGATVACRRDGVIARLVDGAEAAFLALRAATAADAPADDASAADDALDALGATLSEYWRLKTMMAAGSLTAPLAALLHTLRPLSSGLSLAGAGGGGFAVVVLDRRHCLAEGGGRAAIRAALDGVVSALPGLGGLSVHGVALDVAGLQDRRVQLPASEGLEQLLLLQEP